MRLPLATALTLALLAAAPPAAQRAPEPFMPIGVWYGGGTSRAPMLSRNPAGERNAWRSDLQSIKSLGFNSVKTWVDWASTEPVRGQYRFDALEQLLSLADDV